MIHETNQADDKVLPTSNLAPGRGMSISFTEQNLTV